MRPDKPTLYFAPGLMTTVIPYDQLTCIINDPNGDYLATCFGCYFLPQDQIIHPCKYIAFYRNDEIIRVYQILKEEQHLEQLETSKFLQNMVNRVPLKPDTPYRIFKVKYHKALPPVTNDLVADVSGKKIPYTLYQRYTDIKSLLNAVTTSQLPDAFRSKPYQQTNFSYIEHLKSKGFPVPDKEPERLRELQQLDVWGTPAEPEFDNLTRLACAICKAPTAMIALIGTEETWLKAETGVGDRPVAPRNLSFCQYTIMGTEVVEIKDTQKDERFIDNPYVKGAPHIRFYAAAPLITENGNAIGTLCVINSTPQELDDEQKSQLRHLANEAVLRIQLRKKNKDLESALTELKAGHRHTLRLYEEINHNIDYARKIQEAVLPDASTLNIAFENAFILARPRNKVSGDFFTLFQRADQVFLSVGDCTGYGVPGALMTFLGINALHKIIQEKGIAEPADILHELDGEITRMMRQKIPSTFNREGMDVACCVIDREKMVLKAAGAQRPVWLVREGQLIEIKGERSSIAGGEQRSKVFTSTTLTLKAGDGLYLFTDGITDQFGLNNHNLRKYSPQRLQELLIRIHLLPIDQQQSEVEKELQQWQQDIPQTDDQLFIGIKF